MKHLISIDPLTPFEAFDLASDLYWSLMSDIEMRSLDSPKNVETEPAYCQAPAFLPNVPLFHDTGTAQLNGATPTAVNSLTAR